MQVKGERAARPPPFTEWNMAVAIGLCMLACSSSNESGRPPSTHDSGASGAGGTAASGGVSGSLCAPGTTQECLGPGRCNGAQVCIDGSRWGSCDCGTADAGGRASHDAGIGGVSTAGSGGATDSGAPSDGSQPPNDARNTLDGDVGVDSGICPCAPGTKVACITSCGTTGSATCTPSCTIPNVCVPPAETCNGLDDNCDGQSDETFQCKQFDVVSCTTSCGSTGTRSCSASCSLPTACEVPTEVCNAKDDDCDGFQDNGLSLYGAPLASLKGTDPRRVSVAFTGTTYAVAYLDLGSQTGGKPRRVLVQLYDAAGNATVGPVEVEASLGGAPSLAWNGTVFGIVWSESYTGTGVYFATISPSGVATAPIRFATSNAQGDVTLAAVAPDFVAAFDNYVPAGSSSLDSARINSSGAVVGSVNNISSGARVIQPRFAQAISGLKLFWSDNRGSKYAIFSRALDGGGVPSATEVPLTDGTKDATLWSVTRTASGYAVGYSSFDTPNGSFVIATDATGVPSAQPVQVGSSSIQMPEVTWTGAGFSVLAGDEFQLRDASLARLASFPFWSPATQNIRYPHGVATAGGYFAASVTDGDPPVVRLFGSNGCDAPP